jgi:hypothetical protein
MYSAGRVPLDITVVANDVQCGAGRVPLDITVVANRCAAIAYVLTIANTQKKTIHESIQILIYILNTREIKTRNVTDKIYIYRGKKEWSGRASGLFSS